MKAALYKAAVKDNVKALEELLGPDVDVFSQVTHEGNTALHIGAYHGSRQVVKRLLLMINPPDLEQGERGNGGHGFLCKQNPQGNTALHEAASGGDLKIIEMLVKHEPHLVYVRNKVGETAVFKASLAGHTDIIEMFETSLAANVEMYRRDSDGQTSLHCAVFNKKTDVIEKLMTKKPELISSVDIQGRTALHFGALIPPLKEVVPPFHPLLHNRHAKENFDIAKKLLDYKDGELCGKVDNKKQNPLSMAVKEGNAKMVHLLLEEGGDCIEQVDLEGRNALHLAVIYAESIFDRNSEDMIPMLQSLVSNTKRLINGCDKHKKTPLDIAIDNEDKDELLFSGIIKLVEANGAIRNVKAVGEAELTKKETSKPKWRTEIISLNAVLIGAVAFAAPFDLLQGNPLEGNDSPSIPKWERDYLVVIFYTFMISDTLAMGTSVASTVLLLFAVFGKYEDNQLVQTSFYSVMIALLSILLAFGGALALALGPDYAWLILTIWFMLFVVPLAIRVRTFHSKLYLFAETTNFNLVILEDMMGLIITLIYHVLDIVTTLYWWGLIHPALKWVKKYYPTNRVALDEETN